MRRGWLGVGGSTMALDVDALYQALNLERVGRDCVLKILRPGAAAPIYLTARPVEAAEG